MLLSGPKVNAANMNKGVLLDTTFLIALVNDNDPLHAVARSYHSSFLRKNIPMYLSVIVVTEFHQKQSSLPLLSSGKYIPVVFNIPDATLAAQMYFDLGKARRGDKAQFKDDTKLLAQAKNNQCEFIITADQGFHKAAMELNAAGMLEARSINLSEPYDEAWFNPLGQKSLSLEQMPE